MYFSVYCNHFSSWYAIMGSTTFLPRLSLKQRFLANTLLQITQNNFLSITFQVQSEVKLPRDAIYISSGNYATKIRLDLRPEIKAYNTERMQNILLPSWCSFCNGIYGQLWFNGNPEWFSIHSICLLQIYDVWIWIYSLDRNLVLLVDC